MRANGTAKTAAAMRLGKADGRATGRLRVLTLQAAPTLAMRKGGACP